MHRYKIPFTTIVAFICLLPAPIRAQKVDPYHTASGGFGSLLSKTSEYTIWWAEGAYKIMMDTPAPVGKQRTVSLIAARNEYEPFQVVIRLESDLRDINISVSGLVSGNNVISPENIEIRKVEYLLIRKPTDSYGYRGWWPDPLPAVTGPLNADSTINTTLWFTVYIPSGTEPGKYRGSILLKAPGWEEKIPLELNVMDFTLPETPSIRSGFGLSVDKIKAYHNLESIEDTRAAFDLYMDAFRRYRISPYYFYALSPIKETIHGVPWEGGVYDPVGPYQGKYSLLVEDESYSSSAGARCNETIAVEPGVDYTLEWMVKSMEAGQQYCILAEGLDSDGNLLVFENRMDLFQADTTWKRMSFRIGSFDEEIASVSLTLFPTLRTEEGEETGTVWFDNIILSESSTPASIIFRSDFEIDTDSIDIILDFTDFDQAAERYLNDFGFNSFRLDLKGLGSGTYYSREEGIFAGFSQGTAEYDILMARYLKQIEAHLEERGWLGKEYVYWFDEPGREDYPFVREGMETIKGGAPGITTFLTENNPGPEIMDVTDITCTIWNRIDPAKARRVVERGQEYWSYLCTGPKAPWISEFIDHDAVNLRMWLWGSYRYRLNGILIWATNYWTSRAGSPPGYLQNPWEEAASYVQGYGWPLGKQTNWGNGDGRLWYPPNRDPNNDHAKYIEPPVPSLRIEFLRQGIEDYEYFHLLESLVKSNLTPGDKLASEAGLLLEIPTEIFRDGRNYTRDPQKLYQHRKKVAEMILRIQDSINREK